MFDVSGPSQSTVLAHNTSATSSQIITDDVMIYIHICLNITLRLVISVVGVIANCLNTIIFSKLGLKDSMSVELFSLSVTDFVVEVIQVSSCIFYIIDLVCPSLELRVWTLCYFVFGWAVNTTLSISSWITAIISLERCLCVVFPFKAKQIFTRFRCIIVIILIQSIHMSLGVPYVLDKVKWVDSNVPSIETTPRDEDELGSNSTGTLSSGSTTLNTVIDLVAGVLVSLLLQFVVIASTIWMGYSLQISSRVRKGPSSLTPQVTIKLLSIQFSETLSNRERRLVKVVMSLAIILTVCNAPQVVSAIAYHLVPGLNTEQQTNLSITLWTVTYTFGSLGCSSHFLVYLRLNRNYRKQFHKWFGVCQVTS